MTEIFKHFLLIFYIFFFQLEFFFFLCYKEYFLFSKKVQSQIYYENKKISIDSYSYNFIFIIFFMLISFFYKTENTNLFFYIFLLLLFFFFLIKSFFLLNILEKINNSAINLIIFLFINIFFIFLFIDSFFLFFFFIELYGVLYYFCFLTYKLPSSKNLLNYKNNILLYLWNSFFTSLFLSLGCYFLLKNYGTTNFVELSFLKLNAFDIYIIFIGLSFKLGLPIFHFFKIEIYKYLQNENIFLFSILTIFFNSIFLLFFIKYWAIFNIISIYNYIFIFLIFIFIILSIGLKVKNMLEFFAISSILTILTVLLLFIF